MKTRSIKELLQVILDNFELFEKNFCPGLCDLVLKLWYDYDVINTKEKILIKEYMEVNEPKKTYNDVFWFEPKKQEPRKQWLINEIKKHD